MTTPKSRLGGLLKLMRLPPRKWLLAVEAGAELAAMKVLVMTQPPAKYARLCDGEERWPQDRLPKEKVLELMWAVETVGKYAPEGINCLPKALAVQRMLLRRGARGVIIFGVRRRDNAVDAHAWLVLQGKILVGALPDLDEFRRFPSWPKHLLR